MSIKNLFRLKILSYIAFTCLFLASCEKEVSIETTEVGPDGSPIVMTSNKANKLATFVLSNGNTIEFVSVTTNDGEELGVAEISKGSVKESPFNDESLSIPDMFFALNVKNAPVPRAIAKVAQREHDFEVVESLKEEILVNIEELTKVSYPSIEKGASSGVINSNGLYCDGAFNLFQSHFCTSASYPGNTWWYCSPGAVIKRDHWTTGHRRKSSVGITSVCKGLGIIEHFYKFGGNWYKNHDWNVPASHCVWTRWNGARRDRWIRHSVLNSAANPYVRAVSFFFTS